MAQRVGKWLIWMALVVLVHFIVTSKAPFVYGTVALLLIGFALAGWYFFRYLMPLRRKEAGFEYVRVHDNGAVRELTTAEYATLQSELAGPLARETAIKSRYDERDGYGNLRGIIPRRRVPSAIPIVAADAPLPAEAPYSMY